MSIIYLHDQVGDCLIGSDHIGDRIGWPVDQPWTVGKMSDNRLIPSYWHSKNIFLFTYSSYNYNLTWIPYLLYTYLNSKNMKPKSKILKGTAHLHYARKNMEKRYTKVDPTSKKRLANENTSRCIQASEVLQASEVQPEAPVLHSMSEGKFTSFC